MSHSQRMLEEIMRIMPEQFKQQNNYIVLQDFVMVMNIFPFNDKHNLNMFDTDIN